MSRSRLDLRRSLEALAFGQSGYFTAAQAMEIGYSYQAQKYHVDSGNWTRVDRGLFRLPNWPAEPTDEYVLWTLWSRSLGVISQESALRHHGLSDVDPSRVILTVPPSFQAKHPLVITHPGDVPAEDAEQHRAWRVTTPLRTLVDIADSDLSQEHIERAVWDALDLGLLTRRAILRRSAALEDRAALRLERALAITEERNGN